MSIELVGGASDNGLATMLATLIETNVADHPERRVALQRLRGAVAIVAEDAEVATTLEFLGDIVRVHDGVVGIPDVTVRGGFEQIGDMSRMESWGRTHVPDPRGEVNRAMFKALLGRKLRIYGLPRGLAVLAKMGDVLSVA
jgi:hypothetical protein